MEFPERSLPVLHFFEPSLEFGSGQTAAHPKDGLFLYGPHNKPKKTKDIRMGVVGTIDGVGYFRVRLHLTNFPGVEEFRVEVVRSGGQFGSPQYQVRLFANPKAKVHIVLSEGEQTCVALAAFLTELTTASHKSALVFDDPVTSLDHRWRRKVAERLIAEASDRQIVVFTHDLHLCE